MNFHKIVKIVTGILGVLGIVFLFMVIGSGDEEVKAAAAMGDYSKISPLITLSQVILGIAIIATLVFSLLSLFSDKEKLKKALFSIVGLLVVLGVAYATSEGVETPMKDGEVLSAAGARMVGTGIRMFYFLTIIAIGSMLFSSVKKLIK
jgi:hypothetical protein|tara:strand:+ start:766 stop:1212 length:447 start_codon:yes stop_codon:yes gene_type:complete